MVLATISCLPGLPAGIYCADKHHLSSSTTLAEVIRVNVCARLEVCAARDVLTYPPACACGRTYRGTVAALYIC